MTRALTVLRRIVTAVERDGFGAHAAHVRVGDDAAQFRWSPDVARDVHSVAKGVCVLAAGIAADEGVFDLDAPVAQHLPDLPLGEGVQAVTTRHLLGMRSGIDLPWAPTSLTDWPDLAREFLSRPSRGRVFQYSNASSYTAMRALASVVGDVPAWLQPRLFDPLGIPAPVWDRCPGGWIAAGGGLHLRSGELARIGQLIRDGGVWRGRSLVSSRWVDALHSDWFEREGAPGYTRYALAGWGGPGRAWRLHGAHGQLLVFLDDAVVTITADDHAGADRVAQQVVSALEG
ncbi:serine hydrolase domain-containing protein [Kineococcus sp. TBRC 1896]|uniref:Serine hydrolase domain-containing protein n=1 Tax=Kineococcus mangrovi TaxID=1660183 RepID=A0ABV4I0M9_9ACTN